MQGLGETFVSYITEAKRWQENYIEDSRRWQAELIEAIHEGKESFSERALSAAELTKAREESLQNKFLRSLYFPEIRERHDRISEAHEKTFRWIYGEPHPGDRSWTHFIRWLESNDSLYWITGKAGSGKSTLMKYIVNEARTVEHLQAWILGKTLVIAAYFFWNSGSDIQMSQDGLLRSLLYQILVEMPGLVRYLLPARWEVSRLFSSDPSPWSRHELRTAFRLLGNARDLDQKYCLFIDGLDEFDGNHSNLIDFLKDISSSTQFKICVSSRPWNVFEDAFGKEPNLKLQDLTYPDIRTFIDSSFRSHTSFVELQKRESQYATQLLDDIAQKAAGVFLWVHLVVQSLLAGLLNSDRVSDLKRRLDFLPPDLEDLYDKMLKSLDPFYFQHATQYFQIVQCAREPPTLLCLSFADEELEPAQISEMQPLNDDDRRLKKLR